MTAHKQKPIVGEGGSKRKHHIQLFGNDAKISRQQPESNYTIICD